MTKPILIILLLNVKILKMKNGFIKNIFFKSIIKNEGQFLSGPFKNLVFRIIEKEVIK